MLMEGSRLAATDLHAFLSNINEIIIACLLTPEFIYQRRAYDPNPSNDPNRIENCDLVPCFIFEKCQCTLGISVFIPRQA
jgi:hypothetical protein